MPVVLPVLGFADVLVALLLMLFLAATFPVWSRALSALLSQLPVVGPWAAGNADRLASAWLGANLRWVNAGLAPATNLVDNLSANLATHAQQTERALYWAHDRIAYLLTQYVPQQVGTLRTELYTWVGWIEGMIGQAEQRAQSFALAQVGTLRSELYTWVGWLEAAAARELAAAEDFALQGLDQLRRNLEAELGGLAGSLGADLSKLSGELVAELGRLESLIRSSAADLLGRLEAGLTGAREHADQVGAEAHGYTDSQVAGAVGVAAAATAAVATAVRAIEDSPCQQQCATLGNLGGELDALAPALLFGLVAALHADPRAAVGVIERDVLPDVRVAFDSLAQLVRAI